MHAGFKLAGVLLLSASAALAQQTNTGSSSANEASGTSLTIYNSDLAIARTSVDLDLKPGTSEVSTSKVTSQLEPDSVVLRDASGKHPVQVLEQNYDAAVATQDWMLRKYEGQTIQFQVTHGSQVEMVSGRILRAPSDTEKEPLIEVNGQMQFKLPGQPLFPASTDGLLLKPTLRWKIVSDSAAHFPAELSYLTHGFQWNATYNIVSSSGGASTSGEEPMDLVGWVTISNHSGTDFPDAKVKLMAGDVAVVRPVMRAMGFGSGGGVMAGQLAMPKVTQQAFDDFHLYDLGRTVTLKDRETKQIEFLHGNSIPVKRTYVYEGDGSVFEPMAGGAYEDRGMGTGSEKTVRIEQEFVNSKANHLGMPLPAGTLRFYRRDADGQMEFVGENSIRHTPEDATVRLTTGNAFDVTGERKQTNFKENSDLKTIDESYSITLKNAKDAPVKIEILEHLFRAANWDVVEKSTPFVKQNSSTIVFPVTVPAHGEQTVTYTVHYNW